MHASDLLVIIDARTPDTFRISAIGATANNQIGDAHT
jgi:hypothetical protein